MFFTYFSASKQQEQPTTQGKKNLKSSSTGIRTIKYFWCIVWYVSYLAYIFFTFTSLKGNRNQSSQMETPIIEDEIPQKRFQGIGVCFS